MRAKSIAARIVPLVMTAVIMSACGTTATPPPAEEPSAGAQEYYEHTVRHSGETMALISAWYTGKGSNWTVIQQANPGLKPERIRLGQTIRIPKNVMTRHEAMPGSYVKTAAVKKPKEGETAAAETPAAVNPQEASQSSAPAEAPSAQAAEPARTEAAVSIPVSSSSAPQQEAASTPEDEEKERLLDELLK